MQILGDKLITGGDDGFLKVWDLQAVASAEGDDNLDFDL